MNSLWSTSATVPPVDAPSLQEERMVELAIIGGGFIGLSTALHAAEIGCSVAAIEAGEIGYGASGRNGGQVNPGVKLDETALAARFGESGRGLYRLGQEAPDYLADLVARKNLRGSFRRTGVIRLTHNQRALATARSVAKDLRASGIAVEDLDAAEVKKRVGTARYPGGFFDPRGGSVHPLDLAREMARACKEAGVVLFANSPALSLQHRNGRWRIVTPGGALTARKVLVATNAYTDALLPGLAQSLLPVNSFQVATAPLGDLADRILPGEQTVYDSRRLILYFRKSPDGRLMLGGRASFSSSRNASDKVADYSVLEKVLHDIFPTARDVPITHHWTGLVGVTVDYLPHYHALPDDLHVMIGYNGRGVALSHRVGAWLGRKLAGKPERLEIPTTPIKPFPFHAWRETVLHLGMQWNRLLDVFGY
ncbi:MAG: FAD-binding oxidoreductase [Rhodospirillaceae bacterium]|nr:MAG: FAD-binding oxidoreductase [Rhodospirillaceae bacterium]